EECLKVCQEVQKELEAEDQPFDPNVQKGIMIETPAAIMIADELAQKVDFFSVGINDLTQYILACDRMNNDLDKLFDPHHPAIIKSLKIAAEAAHKAGIWIGVCGELSAQPAFLDLFLSLGIDELSVPPNAVLPLRAAIRRSKVSK
ncbi:MAG: phosphoenolpyruvate--protein phosphotransferase, partial [Lachnospiraceae bacterium]|nr:phosphoenolpyruvate--protein phosphotransferase [Candidatus Equihabitans merdae]